MTDPASLFNDAVEHMRAGRLAEARPCLEQAAAGGHADALALLGVNELYGHGGDVDLPRARDMFEQAEAKGSAVASYQLALLGWCGRVAPRDPAEMGARLVRAAEQDYPAALRALAMAYVRRGAREPEYALLTERCLMRAAALLDRTSCYLLALLCSAHRDPVKRAAAPRIMAMAAELGVARARARVAPGTASVRVDAQPMANLPLPVLEPFTPLPTQVHHERPLLETIDGFLAPIECEYLIAWSEPFQHASVVVSDDGKMVPHPDRTSTDANLVGVSEDFTARMLQARMTDQLGVPLTRAEHLTVLHYGPGAEYRPHVDFLPQGAQGNRPLPNYPGQRVDTIFAYLDEVEAGGETEFPRIGRRVRPARGRIVHFRNCRDDMTPDPLTVHAGLPVLAGSKWLATIWTRERDYRRY